MADEEQFARLKEGVEVWNEWREKNPSIEIDLTHADLSGANLTGANLADANLTGARFSDASLTGARFTRAILTGARFTRAILTRAILTGAGLDKAGLANADLRSADLSGANLSSADLSSANLSSADLSGANLARANLTGVYLVGANISETGVRNLQYDRSRMRRCYAGLRGVATCYGDALFKRDAADQDYLDTLEDKWSGQHYLQLLFWLWGLFDYGRSILRVFAFAFVFILFFGVVFTFWPEFLCWPERERTAFTPFYYSVVTYTTLGFGDVTPRTLGGELLVTVEVMLGYLTLGLLLAILAEKVARRG